MKQPRIAAVAFDLDGLMFNTEELYTEVGGEILGRRGKQVTRELLDQMMGRPSRVALQIMIDWHQLDATVEQLQAETDEVFTGLLHERLAPMPGLHDLLGTLETAKVPKAVTTSSRRPFVELVLNLSGLEGRFEFLLTAEDVRNGKPHPEIYRSAARRFAVEPGELMVLEDSENGCRAAVAAGAFTVAVPSEHSAKHDFSNVHLIAQSLADTSIYAALGLA